MTQEFNNRVYGIAIIKSINSNYNADFSGQPRKLPNGTVYATDKALKYTIRNYWKEALGERVFYFKTLTDDMAPRTLDETYEYHFGEMKNSKGAALRKEILSNIINVIDVKIFGGTYAGKTNLSIHGPCQITHGVNRFPENVIYTEQIMSPFKNPGEKSKDSTMTTLGAQSKLEEGHYVHHFSFNPKNIDEHVERVEAEGLRQQDIDMLKEGLRKGASYYDSAAKSGTENEVLFWIQLKESSTLVMPSFIEFIEIDEEGTIDMKNLTDYLSQSHISGEIELMELFYNDSVTTIVNAPQDAEIKTI